MSNLIRAGILQQMVNSSGPSVDVDYQAVITFASGRGDLIPSLPRQAEENAFYLALKAESGLWGKIDALVNSVTDGDSDFATINGKTRANHMVKIGNPIYSSMGAFTGNGTTAYLEHTLNIGSDSVGNQFSQNSGHVIVAHDCLGVTNSSYSRAQADLSSNSSSNRIRHAALAGAYGNALNSASEFVDVDTSSAGDVVILNRVSSTEFTLHNNMYPNGVLLSRPSSALNAITYLRHLRQSSNYSLSKHLFSGFGGGLTLSQATAYRNAVKTLTSL